MTEGKPRGRPRAGRRPAPVKKSKEAVRLGTVLRGLREGAGLTGAELARRAGVDPSQVLRFEVGERVPVLETAARLARALGVSLSVFDLPPARDAEGASAEGEGGTP